MNFIEDQRLPRQLDDYEFDSWASEQEARYIEEHPDCTACGDRLCLHGCCVGREFVTMRGHHFCAGVCASIEWHNIMVEDGWRRDIEAMGLSEPRVLVTPPESEELDPEDITSPIPVRVDGVSYESLKAAKGGA